MREKSRRRRQKDPERLRAYARARYLKNPEYFKAAVRRFEAANPEKARVWANSRQAHRRATKLRATPPWLTDEDRALIRLLYQEAVALTMSTGIEFHVDHIVPLRGQTIYGAVSGLHVPWNLQVIPASHNLRKHNKLRDESEFLAV